MYRRSLIQQPHTSRMQPHKEVKPFVHVSSVDCQATWLRIVPPDNRTKEPMNSSINKGSRISPTVRLILWLSRKLSNPSTWYWVYSLQTDTLQPFCLILEHRIPLYLQILLQSIICQSPSWGTQCLLAHREVKWRLSIYTQQLVLAQGGGRLYVKHHHHRLQGLWIGWKSMTEYFLHQ
jgi:hypothetical protein